MRAIHSSRSFAATWRRTAFAKPEAPEPTRHPHREQLVDPEPQRVEDLGLHLAERSVHAGGEDRVVRPASADRPRHQLGDERGVPAGEPVVAQHDRQHEVGVRVVDADGLEHVHGGGAGRVRRRSRGR
jgi:hypothetical protein